MNFLKSIWKGIYCYVDGTKFIFKHKLYAYFLAPIILGVLLYLVGEYFGELSKGVKAQGDNMHDFMVSLLEKEFWTAMEYMFKESQKYIAVMILSTVWAILSEKVEEILTGNEYPFVWKYYVADIKRGLRINVWAMIQEYLIFFIWLIVSLIIGLPDELNTIMALVIGFWYYGWGYMDYILERRRMNITQSVHFGRQHAGLAFGIGIIYSLSFEFIPFGMGLMVAPIAMVGTTLVMNELVDLRINRYAKSKNSEEVEDVEETPNSGDLQPEA